MEALIESSIAANQISAPDSTDLIEPGAPPPPHFDEQELANLVINESGEQKYVGESASLAPRILNGTSWYLNAGRTIFGILSVLASRIGVD